MTESLGHLNMISLFALAILGGSFGAHFLQRLRAPQVVIYIIIGTFLGDVLEVIPPEVISKFDPFLMFALGIIGFLIGGELKRDIFTKFAKQVAIILSVEGGRISNGAAS